MKIPNLPAYIFSQLQSQGHNPFLRQACLTNLADTDVSPYVYGKEVTPATRDLIKSAKKEVIIQFFRFLCGNDESDAISEAFIYLNQHNPQGIDIKILFDHLSGPSAHTSYRKLLDNFKDLQFNNGVWQLNYHGKIYPLPNLNIGIKTHDHFFGNVYHTKQIIVDRERMMLRSGDVGPETNYKHQEEGRHEMAHIINNKALATKAAESFDARYDPRHYQINQFSQLLPPKDKGQTPVLLLEKQSALSPIKAYTSISPFHQALITAINMSEKSVHIATPNINTPAIVDALARAAARGVKVNIVIGKFHNDLAQKLPGMGGGNQNTLVKLYHKVPFEAWDNVEVRWARDKDQQLILNHSVKTMHCKLAIVDEEIVLAGTSPLDLNSSYRSAENDFVMQSRVLAKLDEEKIFKPIFEAGENILHQTFDTIKSIVVVNLQIMIEKNQAALTPTNQTAVNHYDHALNELLKKIKKATDYHALALILAQARDRNPMTNRLAVTFNQGSKGLFAHSPLNKAYLASLDKLYDALINKQVITPVKEVTFAPKVIN